MDPGAASYVLHISAGSERPLFPTISADPSYHFPDAEGVLRILVPQVEPLRYIGFVEACAEPVLGCDDDDSAVSRVSGALLTLRSEDFFDETTGVTGEFQTTTRTDESGKFEVDLLPGTYEVVVSGAGSDHGVRAETVRLDASDMDTIMGQVFVLPPRARIGGEVQTRDLHPVQGATVHADALGRTEMLPDEAARYNRSADTVTDSDGRFILGLDVGAYDLVVRPPPEAGFPWIVSPDRRIGFTGGHLRDRFEFSTPVVVMGELHDTNGMAVVGAELAAHGLITSAEGDARAVELGRATTDEEGRYVLLLPPRL